MFEENKHDKPGTRRVDALLLYIIAWFSLAVGGRAVYDFWLLPSLSGSWYGTTNGTIAKNPLGASAYVIWLVVTTLLLAPYLTKKFIGRLYPVEARPSPPIRKRIRALFMSVWEFLKDVSLFLRTILFSYYLAFLLPWGLVVAIVFGGWFYFLPFLTANILVAYKFNKARKVRGVEAYDDKRFTSYEKSLDDYLELVRRSKEQKKGLTNQSDS